jgi:hypothetical protein
MTWLLTAALVWAVLAVAVALVLGRGIRLADERVTSGSWTADVEKYLRDHTAAPLP